MSRSLSFIATFLISASSPHSTPSLEHNCNLHPPQSMEVPENSEDKSSISKMAYESLIQRFVAHFGPFIKKEQGATLVLEPTWTTDQVKARASRDLTVWKIEVTGGLARHPAMTLDGLTLVLCHELGHHLGGFPKYTFSSGNWSSVEGQADYYSTTKCTRSFWENDDNFAIAAQILNSGLLPYSVVSSCKDKHRKFSRVALCIRSNWAAVAVSRYFAHIFTDRAPHFDTPNRTRTHRTIELHPSVQCRLDTFYQGSLCTVSHNTPFGTDESSGACTRKEQQPVGARPLCWYLPTRLF